MYPPIGHLRALLAQCIRDRDQQGHDVRGMVDALAATPDSYDALLVMAERIAELPLRPDWPYHEPNDLAAIEAASDAGGRDEPLGSIAPVDAAARARTGFLASVCGCELGKPVEVNPTLVELRSALQAVHAWPLDDYVPVAALDQLGRRSGSWLHTCRENIACAAADDDISYTILGMLVLEQHGLDFTTADFRQLFLYHVGLRSSWGPERTMLLKHGRSDIGYRAEMDGDVEALIERAANVLNPGDELCGAQIRADAYGYACPGRPVRAARLAWRDARFTHRRTGVYATMFTAAAIAAAYVLDDPLEVFESALRTVPRRSRFHEAVSQGLSIVEQARDWLDAYEQIHARFGQFSHCRVYQETCTLINTLRFADSAGDGICRQVMQGNDTDSYGATAGALLGVFLGEGSLDGRWLQPLNDTVHTSLIGFPEQRLSAVADRVARLPALTVEQGKATL